VLFCSAFNAAAAQTVMASTAVTRINIHLLHPLLLADNYDRDACRAYVMCRRTQSVILHAGRYHDRSTFPNQSSRRRAFRSGQTMHTVGTHRAYSRWLYPRVLPNRHNIIVITIIIIIIYPSRSSPGSRVWVRTEKVNGKSPPASPRRVLGTGFRWNVQGLQRLQVAYVRRCVGARVRRRNTSRK
jgi:hypothetical protein